MSSLRRGDTLLAGGGEGKLHLHVVLTEPTSKGEVILVPITTLRSRSDRTVHLDVGDHPFIQHPSVVAYAYARIEIVSVIEQDLKDGKAFARVPLSTHVLKRIIDGLLESDFTENGVRHFFRSLSEG